MTHRKLKTHAAAEWVDGWPLGMEQSMCGSIIDDDDSDIWSNNPTCKHCDRILKKKKRRVK